LILHISALSSHLWEAANILRGPVDAADFKTYIFPLLFFKRLSDVYDEEIRKPWKSPAATWNSPGFPRITGSRFRRAATGRCPGGERKYRPCAPEGHALHRAGQPGHPARHLRRRPVDQ
jgi:hypothetical protein